MRYIFYYSTEIGEIGIQEQDGAITDIFFGKEQILANTVFKETHLIKETAKQLKEYFVGKRRNFELPLAPKGTVFQQEVWRALSTIPYGETRSYKQIAELIGKPKACRAVGMANNRNPLSIVVPCHRVIGANGALVGYGGGLHIKKQLLDLEQG